MSSHFPTTTRNRTRFILALAVVFAMIVVGIGTIPAVLSPIGPVQAQDSPGASNVTIEFANQTANGSTVTIKRATLPEGGFVVLSNNPYEEIGILKESMIAVSKPLSPGTHENVTIQVNNSPPGGFQNRTMLNTTSDYSVGLYRDGNNNSRFEYITTDGTNDTAYLTGSGTEERFASDTAVVTIPGSNTPTATATIHFRDQSSDETSVTIDSVTLPRGGFVVVHNESYLRGGDPTQTAIGLSRYLSTGTHQDVSVALVNGSVQQSQTLVAVPSLDTNNNQTYDYVRSDGFQDVPYTANNEAVTGRAVITVASNASSTATPTSGTSGVNTDMPGPTAASTETSQPTANDSAESGKSATQWLTVNRFIVIAVIIVVGGYLLVRRS